MEEEEQGNGLSKGSTLDEVFNYIDMSAGGVNVRPVSLDNDPKDTRLAIFIRGEHQTASFIMAQLMTEIQNLYDQQAQMEATEKPLIERV